MSLPKRLPWPHLFAESVVIVVSILLAFGVDAWWDWTRERSRERTALTRLDAEFSQIEPILVRWQAHHAEVLEVSRILLEHAHPSKPSDLTEDSIAALISPIRFVWALDPPLATLRALQSSGELETVRSQELLTHLASWQATIEDLQKDEEHLRQRLSSHFIPFLQSRIAYRSLGPGSAPAWGPSAFPSGLRGVLADREFEGLLDEQMDQAATNVSNYDDARESLIRLRGIIRRELDR